MALGEKLRGRDCRSLTNVEECVRNPSLLIAAAARHIDQVNVRLHGAELVSIKDKQCVLRALRRGEASGRGAVGRDREFQLTTGQLRGHPSPVIYLQSSHSV